MKIFDAKIVLLFFFWYKDAKAKYSLYSKCDMIFKKKNLLLCLEFFFHIFFKSDILDCNKSPSAKMHHLHQTEARKTQRFSSLYRRKTTSHQTGNHLNTFRPCKGASWAFERLENPQDEERPTTESVHRQLTSPTARQRFIVNIEQTFSTTTVWLSYTNSSLGVLCLWSVCVGLV